MKKICIVTGNRSDYGIYFPILNQIRKSRQLKLQIIVTSSHLSESYGLTYKEIKKDGFKIDYKIENLIASNSDSSIVKSSGLAMIALSDAFKYLSPDLVLLVGDRFETLASASSAILMNIPIYHIHGGEVTEGSIDEKIRHAITKMSSFHFTSTTAYRDRVIQMGENPKNVVVSGAPSLDNLMNMTFLTKINIEKFLSWKLENEFILFTFHPETAKKQDNCLQIKKILMQLKKTNLQILFTSANCDHQGELINNEIRKFVKINKDKYFFIESLGHQIYLSVMNIATVIIGNSSSGIIEAATLNKPVINIGDRQKGRVQSNNVINCSYDSLGKSIKKALSFDFKVICKNCINIYGDGKASKIIVENLINKKIKLTKSFYDIKK